MLVRPTLVLGLLCLGLGGSDDGRWLGRSLSPIQAQTRHGLQGESNLQNCLHGLSGCDVSALTPDEIKQVSQVSMKKKSGFLHGGLYTLRPHAADPGRRLTSVQAARYRRNLTKCDHRLAHLRAFAAECERRSGSSQDRSESGTTISAWRVLRPAIRRA